MSNEEKKIWYLVGPSDQYVEDVKALAREAGLRIIDATVTEDRTNAAEITPTVTLKPGAVATGPTVEQLNAAHDQLQQESERLRSWAESLEAEAFRQSEQREVLESERQRLVDLSAELERKLAAVPAAAAPAGDSGDAPSTAVSGETKAPKVKK